MLSELQGIIVNCNNNLMKLKDKKNNLRDKIKVEKEHIEGLNSLAQEMREYVTDSCCNKGEVRITLSSPVFPGNNKEFDFDKKNELCNKYDVNAKYALSTGQLNILALSIFFALSEVSDDYWETIFLDDFIQAMDDIHVAKFAEIIRRFLFKRQVIMTTNNRNLLELLKKKCREQVSNNNIIIYEFMGVNEGGPKFISYYLGNEKKRVNN